MNYPEKPPLSSLVYEQIAQLLHKVDKDHWPLIAAFRMRTFIPLSEPVPPRVPQLLLSQIRVYASMLFKAEADQYQQFASDPLYRTWLTKLEERVLARALDTVEKIDKADPGLMLMVHGLEHPSMVSSLREMLWELGNGYAWKVQPKTPAGQSAQPASLEEESQTPRKVPDSSEAVGSEDGNPPDKEGEPKTGNRQRIDAFILRMSDSGMRIKRTDIWKAAGYKNRTEFERFQRGDERNRSAAYSFNRILRLDPESFRHAMKKAQN